MGYIPFEQNCRFYSRASYKKNFNFRSQSQSVNKLATQLQELLFVYKDKFQYNQELQK